jgi:unsaturated chondroitin disaccharide hydrolase
LGQYVNETNKKLYVTSAEKIIRSLSSDKYRAKLGENGGFILMHSVGSIPSKSEIDVPLTYSDYYFLEALLRFKKWYL